VKAFVCSDLELPDYFTFTHTHSHTRCGKKLGVCTVGEHTCIVIAWVLFALLLCDWLCSLTLPGVFVCVV